MRLLVAYDHHFLRAADGAVYVGHPMAVAGYVTWQPYLRVFEEVTVLGRVGRLGPGEVPRAVRADGPGVEFHGVPDYLGPWQYVWRYPSIALAVRRAVGQADAYILKVPGALSHMARRQIMNRARPYALEVVADPWDALGPGTVRSIVRPVIRRRWANTLRSMCRGAAAISYVTREALQRRYPPGPRTWSTSVSDVDLVSVSLGGEDLLEKRIERWDSALLDGRLVRRLRIGFTGALGSLYKAPDVLLRAVAASVKAGLDSELAIVGDGKHRPALQAMARDLGIEDRVQFLGALPPGAAIQGFLDSLDLFVLPSRQEGLPRAMVEAMARGCPCVGSTVGGIPELLPAEDLVRPDDVEGLAAKLRELFLNPVRLERMTRRNLAKASEYRPELLDRQRTAFYRKVREQAEDAA